MKGKLFCNRTFILAVCISVTVFVTSDSGAINTQLQTDSTLSGITALNVDVPGADQVYTLSEIHGKAAGNNLFYSFSNFNIGETDTVSFNLDTPDLANVISRVTGGSESFIEGTLKMTNVDSAPSFFLINSSGITFGSGASVDVPGAFYTSTASMLNLDDGSEYSANETGISTLSAANPESFGFLGDETGEINIGSSDSGVDRTNLTFKPGTDVGFVANQIQIDNASITNEASSQAGIDLQIVATGEESAQIELGTLVKDQTTAGNLTINASNIEVSGDGSGYLGIQAGNFTASRRSDISADNSGDISMTAEHGVDVSVSSKLILDNDAFLSSDAHGNGDAGLVMVRANNLSLISGGKISSSTSGEGDAGFIKVKSNQIEINGEGSESTGIFSSAQLDSTGGAGSITVAVETLNLINGGVINNETNARSEDKPVGSVSVFANTIALKDGGNIRSTTRGDTDAGFINIFGLGSSIVEEKFVDVETIRLINGGLIDSSTFGEGDAGLVNIQAKQVHIDGQGNDKLITGISVNASLSNNKMFDSSETNSNSGVSAGLINIQSDTLNLTNNGSVTSETYNLSTESSGLVKIFTNKLSLSNGGSIRTSTSGKGNAGFIIVKTRQFEISGGGDGSTGVFSSAENNSTGNAGAIAITGLENTREQDSRFLLTDKNGIKGGPKEDPTDNDSAKIFVVLRDISKDLFAAEIIQISNGGQIDSSTVGSGNAGSVEVNASQIEINGEGGESTGIFSSAKKGSSGQTGNIVINAENIRLSSNSIISIENNANVADINSLTDTAIININTTNLLLTDSRITAKSSGNVDAGDIHISFKDQMFLNSSTIINPSTISTEANDGRGGDIIIEGGDIIYLRDSAITTSVKGESGDGGDINVAANSLIMSSGFIQANTTASGASGGKVTIKTPTLIPSGNFLQTGGNTPLKFQSFSGLNVIQAAAPDGISGSINASAPQLNLSGMLTNLAIESFGSNALNRNMCNVDEGSSLFQSGKGGMRMRARDFLLSPML